jgi:hypothetical protein
MALLAGTITLGNVRVLGAGLRRIPMARWEKQTAPWKRWGLGIVLATGPLLFAADTRRYLRNPALLVKMALLAIALIWHFTPPRSKRSAAVSLALWTLVVLASRAIADFDIY